jgi:DNA mismatch endonuclease (patch repair protein)
MKEQRRRDTKPEFALRSELWRRGLRYRVDYKVVGNRRRVDIAFTRARIAVFVDGCFWHMCPKHRSLPKTNRDWWLAKLEANAARDESTNSELERAGWTVVRVWEHEDTTLAADRVEELVRGRVSGGGERVEV